MCSLETFAAISSIVRVRRIQMASTLAGFTELESRITIPGHVQRGGTSSPGDRLLVTGLGISLGD